MEKIETYLQITAMAVILYYLNKLIKGGQSVVDKIVGDNPLDSVGTSEDPGWLTQWYMWKSNNPEIDEGDVWESFADGVWSSAQGWWNAATGWL